MWKLSVVNPEHNGHIASSYTAVHPSLRRRAIEKLNWKEIDNLLRAGASPSTILSSIQQKYDGKLPIIPRDLYNRTAKLLKAKLKARTPIQALLTDLREAGMEPRYQLDDKGHVTHLFFIHPRSLEIWKTHYDVLLLDCTYKTNKFRMPLLNYVFATDLHTNVIYGGF